MRLARGVLGSLLWILAGLLGLVSILLCVTLILLPLGIPLFRLSRAMFGKAVRLMMPPAVAHPVKHTGKKGRRAKKGVADLAGSATKKGRRAKAAAPDLADKAGKAAKKGRKLARRQRKRLR
jgi:hypothetical protein